MLVQLVIMLSNSDLLYWIAGFSYHRTNVHSWSGRGSWLSAGRQDTPSLGLAKHMTVLIPEEGRGGTENTRICKATSKAKNIEIECFTQQMKRLVGSFSFDANENSIYDHSRHTGVPCCGINICCQPPLISLFFKWLIYYRGQQQQSLQFTVSAGWSVHSHLVAARAGQCWLAGWTHWGCERNAVTGWNVSYVTVQPATKQR